MIAKRLLVAAGMSCALLAGASVAHAQATRTWVSGVGDDANPCSRTAPCKTFAGAISKTAARGEINTLDSGGFGTVTITKAISFESVNLAGVLASNTNGIIVNAGPSDVITLRGLTLDGAGTGLNGIRILSAGTVHIEGCTIQNFVNRGILIENSSGNVQVFVRDSVIRNNVLGGSSPPGNSGGIYVKPVDPGFATVVLDNVRVDQNVFGLRAENNARVTATRSSFSGNLGFGVLALSSNGGPVNVTLEDSTLASNSAGLRSDGAGARVRMSGNVVTLNTTGLFVANSGQILSFGNNRNDGNFSANGAPTSTLSQQ